MKERPINLRPPEVRGIIDGRQTQIRRVVKPQPPSVVASIYLPFVDEPNNWHGYGQDAIHWYGSCPHGQPGERLWGRETWYCDDYRLQRGTYLKPDDLDVAKAQEDGTLVYRASSGDRPYEAEQPIWRPSIHMPRWACRITLDLISVRVERLKDISRGDAMAEGCPFPNMAAGEDPRAWYAELWERLNGPGSWGANPWVWVLSFTQGGAE